MRVGCAIVILIALGLLGAAGYVAFGDPPRPSVNYDIQVTPAAR